MVSSDKVDTLHAVANKKDKLSQSFDRNDPTQFRRLIRRGQQIAWRVIKPLNNQQQLTAGSGRAGDERPAHAKVNVDIKGVIRSEVIAERV